MNKLNNDDFEGERKLVILYRIKRAATVTVKLLAQHSS